MKFIHMHETLRREILRRIDHGALTITLLARQTGLAQAHVSNFLREKRRLSRDAMDLVLNAQSMEAEDLLPSSARHGSVSVEEEMSAVPVVSHSSALSDPVIHPSAVLAMMPLPWARFYPSERAKPPTAPPGRDLLPSAFRPRTPCPWSR